MAEIRAFCPECGSIDLVTTTKGVILGPDTNTAKCQNCGWAGLVSETIGAATTEQFWDIERVGNVMIRVVATRAAGPLVQLLEFTGLLPKMIDLGPLQGEELIKAKRRNESAQRARDQVMSKTCEAAITAAFEEAEKANRVFAVEHDTSLHPMLRDVTAGDKVFGGNVLALKKSKKKKR